MQTAAKCVLFYAGEEEEEEAKSSGTETEIETVSISEVRWAVGRAARATRRGTVRVCV